MFKISPTQSIFFLIFLITNVATINVLTSPSFNHTPVEIPESDISGLDAFTVCFRVFSHQFNKNFNPLITLSSSLGPNTIQFGTGATPCHYSSGKIYDSAKR